MQTSLFRRIAALLILVPALGATAPDEGDDAYRFLVGLSQKGMHEMVVKEGESFLREHPRHAKTDLARYRLGSALFELDRKREAAPHFEALTAKRGFEYGTESWFRLAQCRLGAEDWRGAQQALEKVVAAKDEYLHEHASFLLADCAFRLDDFARAEKGYLDILRGPPGEYARDAASGAAWCAWRLERTDDAIQRIEDFLSRFGDDPADGYADELRIVLGEARMRKEDPERALEAYRAVADGPQKAAALRGIGFARAELGDHAGAARAFGELLDLDPRGRFAEEAALFRGIHLLKADDAKGALGALARAGSGPDALFWTARAQEAAGQREAALRTLDKALAARPDPGLTARIQAARGDILFALGRGDEAVAAYEEGGSDYAVHAAAVAALNGGEADEAVRLAEGLLERYPKSPYRERTLLVLGEAHFQRGRYAESERVLAPLAASAGEPGQRVRALSRVAWCRYLSGDASGAAELFGRVAAEHADAPEAEEALYMQGRAAEETGDAATAVRAWRSYVRDHPGGERCDRVLAGLARHEDLGQAAERVRRLLAEHPESPLLSQALFEHAERCNEMGEPGEAAGHYRELLKRFPDDGHAAGARYGLAWCLAQEGRYEEAAEQCEAIRGVFGAPAELRASAMELAVWAHRRSGNADGAAGAWRAFAELSDDDERLFAAAKTAALALKEAGRAKEGQELLDRLLDRVKSREVAVDVLVEGAYMALENGDVDQAEAQVRVAKKRAPDDPAVAEASFFVAEAHFEAGQDQRAIELYETASSTPGSPVADLALYKQAFAKLRQDDTKGAERDLTALVAGAPDSSVFGESLFLLGEVQFRLGKYEEAAASLSRLAREHPRHEVIPKALFRLGLAQGRLEHWNESSDALEKLSKTWPDFENLAEADLWRGRAAAGLGRGRTARQAFQRVIANDRGVLAAQARIGLGKLARVDGDDETALAEFLKVAVLYASGEEVAEALWLAGRTLEDMDDSERAKEQYREIVEKHAESRHAAQAKARLREMK